MSSTTTQSKSAYMCLDGLVIEIGYEDSEVNELLEFLRADMTKNG